MSIGLCSGIVLTTAITLIQILALKSEPSHIPKSPEELFQWYQGFSNRVLADEIAAKGYYGHYVEWELVINDYYPEKTISTLASIIDPTPTIYCFFSEKKPEPYRMKKGNKVLIRGTLKKFDLNHIELDKCKVLKFL